MAEEVKAAGIRSEHPVQRPAVAVEDAMMPHGSRRTRSAPIACVGGFHGELTPIWRTAGAINKIIVRQIRPGLRVKAPFMVNKCERTRSSRWRDCSNGENARRAVADVLFELTQPKGRLLQMSEIMEMVARYQTAPSAAE